MPSQPSTAVVDAAETIAANCLAGRIRLLHRTITAIFDEALRPLGLTDAQLTILVMIASRGPISPGAVAKRLNMEKSTISRNVARMDRNGWLSVADGESVREQRLTLSAEGRTMLVEALPSWKKAQAEVQALLGVRGANSIRRMCNSVVGQQG